MADFTIKHIDDFESNSKWKLARRSLGVKSFGINIVDIPPGEDIPEHDEVGRDQEEVYITLSGEPTAIIDGKEYPAPAGTYVRFDVTPKRQYVNRGKEVARVMVVSAPRTSGYEPMSWG